MFEVIYKNGSLQLLKTDLLASEEEAYLIHYLSKLSRYKVIGHYQQSPVFSLYQPPLATRPGIRSLNMRLKRRFLGERIPASATIAVNKACQCECLHCSAVFYNHSAKKELSRKELENALRETVDLGVTNLILLGGEPLLRPDLVDQIRSVQKDQSVVTLFTNGEFLTFEKCKELAEAGLMGVFVSLDSTDEKTHDQLRRRKGLFKKALQGISHLQKMGILIALSSYLSPTRLREGIFEGMMELGKECGVNEVTFFDAIPSGRWIHATEPLLGERERIEILDLVRYYRTRPNYPGVSAQSTLTSPQGSAFCFAANTQFYLTAHGEMCPCDFTPLTIGKFPEEGIAILWSRMIRTPPYHCRAKSCRMQNSNFRRKYIDPLHATKDFPATLTAPEIGELKFSR